MTTNSVCLRCCTKDSLFISCRQSLNESLSLNSDANKWQLRRLRELRMASEFCLSSAFDRGRRSDGRKITQCQNHKNYLTLIGKIYFVKTVNSYKTKTISDLNWQYLGYSRGVVSQVKSSQISFRPITWHIRKISVVSSAASVWRVAGSNPTLVAT